MKKAQISNPRFELVTSTLKGHKEVQVTYDFNGSVRKYFIFIEEGKSVNYIAKAKKIFDNDLKSGKVLKVSKARVGGVARPWLLATTGVLGAAAVTFGALFAWKAITSDSNAWYLDTKYLNSLTVDDVKAGTIQMVKVNGVYHQVRLIGIDHDELADKSGKKAHTTWEFTNVISDKNGYSLATFWNDTATNVPCASYLDSTMRYALVGKYEDKKPSFGWYEKESHTKSKKYNDPVIKMLPSDLVEKIKPVTKKVAIFDKVAGTCTTIDCKDKLFILSSDEMGQPNDERELETGTLYDYYNNEPSEYTQWDERRIKKQVKGLGKEHVESPADITDGLFDGPKENIAGYNSSTENCGTGYWLRDIAPKVGFEDYEIVGSAYGGSSGGAICAKRSVPGHGDGNELAAPIAPAFCL